MRKFIFRLVLVLLLPLAMVAWLMAWFISRDVPLVQMYKELFGRWWTAMRVGGL